MTDSRREDEALDWARRIADPQFIEWDEHVEWLESDPANAQAFDTALLLMADATIDLGRTSAIVSPDALTAQNDNFSTPRGKRAIAWAAVGSAMAAGFIGFITLRPGGAPATTLYTLSTADGHHESLQLPDGSRLALNGATRVELDRADGRWARLVEGQVFFTVRHDDRHPFVVKTDRALFQDLGTSFDVRTLPAATEIQVHDGAVLFDPGATAVRLVGGQAMLIAQNGAEVRSIDPAAAGSWRSGRLTYRDAMLSVVAADLQRNLGMPVTVDESIADRHFSGVIMLDGDRKRLFERIGILMNVTAERRGHGWRLKRHTE